MNRLTTTLTLRLLPSLRLLPHLILTLSCVVAAGAEVSTDRPAMVAPDDVNCARLKSTRVMRPGAPVNCSQLQIVRFSYIGFDDRLHNDGEVMVMAAVAPEVHTIFSLLLARRFPLAGAHLMNSYLGDDDASMADNNTSAFNYRPITGGGAPSLHAYGLAIDINPLQNPYLLRSGNGRVDVSPAAGKAYVARLPLRPGMVDDQVVQIFAAHGFPIWGGDWRKPIDYQHFQVSRKTAEHLAKLGLKEGRTYFKNNIQAYQSCLVRNRKMSESKRFCTLAE